MEKEDVYTVHHIKNEYNYSHFTGLSLWSESFIYSVVMGDYQGD